MKKELKSGILSADKLADHRPINRPTVGRTSAGLMLSRFKRRKKYRNLQQNKPHREPRQKYRIGMVSDIRLLEGLNRINGPNIASTYAKTCFCICEIKYTDQLPESRAADQHLDSTIPLHS